MDVNGAQSAFSSWEEGGQAGFSFYLSNVYVLVIPSFVLYLGKLNIQQPEFCTSCSVLSIASQRGSMTTE